MRLALTALNGPKLRRRALTIGTNAINVLLVPMLSPLVSLLVVRLASPNLWGEFVHVAIIAQLGAHVVGWGNKEYLLRRFSRSPSQIARTWRASLFARALPFAGFCVALSLMDIPPQRAVLMALWCLGLALDQSYDALVAYRRAFAFAAIVDLGVLVAMCAAVAWIGPGLSLDVLLGLFAATSLVSAAALALRFRRTLARRNDQRPMTNDQRPTMGSQEPGGSILPSPVRRSSFVVGRSSALQESAGFLRGALPFFLLGLSGMLQSRVDLYVVNAFLQRSEVATYQVFTNMLLYVQTVSYVILSPFIKNIYRMPQATILKLSARLFAAGALMLAPALLVVYATLTGLYHLSVPALALVAGGLLVLPSFCYLPIVYALYREQMQSAVLQTNIIGIGASLLLSVLLLPRVGLPGAVIASALAQWLMLAAYVARSGGLEDRSRIREGTRRYANES